MANAIPYIVAAATAGSGIAQYLGAREEAQVLRDNATAVEETAEYNAIVEKRNAQQEKQALDYKTSVEHYNNMAKIQNLGNEIKMFRKKSKAELATNDMKFGYGGTFSAISDADEKSLFRQESQLLATGSEESLQSSMQIGEFNRIGNLTVENAKYQARNIIHKGNLEARNLRYQAKQTKRAGAINMVTSFANAAIGYKTMTT